MTALTETLRLLLAGYLIALAFAACLGVHQPLLTYPGRALYAAVRVLIGAVTLGRVQITPLARRARRGHARRLRNLRFTLGEMREDTLAKLGREQETTSGSWSSGERDQ